MNTQTEKERTAPSRQFRSPEDRQAPHRQPPANKQAVQSITDRDRNEPRDRKPLPVAQPVRRATSPSRERQGDSSSPRPSRSRRSPSQFDVRMAFSILGFSVAGVLILLFGLDLAMGVPFERISLLMDVTYLFCGIILAGLSWSCWRDLG